MPDLDFYTGAYTGAQIDQRLGNMVVVVSGTITDQNRTINSSKILANHVVIHCELGSPRSQLGDWTIKTYAGYLTIEGDIYSSTTVKLTLGLT